MNPTPTRRFGRTGLPMPVLTCGGMRYQQSWEDLPPEKIPEANQRNLEATIHRALELGINHIETARGYGTSELQLGRILPTIPRADLIVQTKVSPEHGGEKFRKDFERSMSLLRLDHVDLLALHGINTHEILDSSLARGGALEAARAIQREGRARFIGFSTHGPPDVVERAVRTGEFDYVNLHWYWVNRANEPAIRAAAEVDAGLFIISPNDKGGKLYQPPEKLVRLCAPLHPMEFNNLFCLARDDIHTLSIGAARPSDFDIHTASLARLGEARTLVPEIDARLRAAMEETLGAEWLATWSDGIPEWHHIPGEINVHEILRLWNLATALDMLEFGKMRYNLLGQGGHWFPGRNAARIDEPAVREALAASPHAGRIVAILREAHAMFSSAPVQRLGRD
jgi:uncharacterized protein